MSMRFLRDLCNSGSQVHEKRITIIYYGNIILIIQELL